VYIQKWERTLARSLSDMQQEMDRKLESFKRQYETMRKEGDCMRIQSLEEELRVKSRDLATYNAELKRLREQIELLVRDKRILETAMNEKRDLEIRHREEIRTLKLEMRKTSTSNGNGYGLATPKISLTIKPIRYTIYNFTILVLNWFPRFVEHTAKSDVI